MNRGKNHPFFKVAKTVTAPKNVKTSTSKLNLNVQNTYNKQTAFENLKIPTTNYVLKLPI
jgi:hypothetical protein